MNTTELVKNGKHFCVLPWIHFHAWPDSKVMPCCVADSSMPVSNINKDESIIQMMNSSDYKKMRLAMLNDEPVEACKRCYDLELMGTWTMRQSHNKRRGLEYVDLIDTTTRPDGSLTEFKMKYMDIRFSNICNMKCRSCGPDFSPNRSGWRRVSQRQLRQCRRAHARCVHAARPRWFQMPQGERCLAGSRGT